MFLTDKLSRYSSDLKNGIWAKVNNDILSKYHDALCDVADNVFSKYLWHEENVPINDSALEHWEEVQNRLEEKYNLIQDICDDFMEILDDLSDIKDNNMLILSKRIDRLVEDMIEYNDQYRGLSMIGR